MSNICQIASDFQLEINWHFFATSHGKGACDGVGGTVKRIISRLSIQGELIDNPTTFYEIAKERITGIE